MKVLTMEKNGVIPVRANGGYDQLSIMNGGMVTNSHVIPPPQSQVLSSWKEIARYVNRGIRTVQRWEFEYGLPIHRPKSALRGSVFALKDELDRWLLNAPFRGADEPDALLGRLQRLEAECERIRQELARLGVV